MGVALQKFGHFGVKLLQLHLQLTGHQVARQHHAVHHLPVPGVYRVDLMITLGAKTIDECTMPPLFLRPCPCSDGPRNVGSCCSCYKLWEGFSLLISTAHSLLRDRFQLIPRSPQEELAMSSSPGTRSCSSTPPITTLPSGGQHSS